MEKERGWTACACQVCGSGWIAFAHTAYRCTRLDLMFYLVCPRVLGGVVESVEAGEQKGGGG
jgi:hypothetical protein